MKHKIIYILIGILISVSAKAQLSETETNKIDSLFIEWNKPNHPGGSIAIMQGDKINFSKAYGMASLEYLVPNTSETMFNTGSVSKQFTAMGIVLLHLQGKLNIDDDIKKYIPENAKFKETITIRQMLQHTSGLRSLHAMLALAGWRSDDSRTNEDLYRFMEDQRDLNFKPGDEFSYSNTGYMLAAKIIEKVTGETFPVWIKRNVFIPLGMINTYAEDQYYRVVLNNATSYHSQRDGSFSRAIEYWGYVGSGNVHSTTTDLLKWLENFYEPQEGWEEAFKLLQSLNKLNNGNHNNYALGIVIDNFKGVKRIQHGGSVGGFRAFICTFPDQKLSIALLTNFSSSSSYQKIDRITDLLLEIKEEKPSVDIKKELKTISLETEELKKFEAWYWNYNDNVARKIYINNDTLQYFRNENSMSPLVPIGENKFKMLNVDADLIVTFLKNEKDQKIMSVSINGAFPIILYRYVPKVLTKKDLEAYTGKFYSPELKSTYEFTVRNDTLECYHVRHGKIKVKILREDIFECDWPIRTAKFKRDNKGKITGMFVTNGRVRNLWFEKK